MWKKCNDLFITYFPLWWIPSKTIYYSIIQVMFTWIHRQLFYDLQLELLLNMCFSKLHLTKKWVNNTQPSSCDRKASWICLFYCPIIAFICLFRIRNSNERIQLDCFKMFGIFLFLKSFQFYFPKLYEKKKKKFPKWIKIIYHFT